MPENRGIFKLSGGQNLVQHLFEGTASQICECPKLVFKVNSLSIFCYPFLSTKKSYPDLIILGNRHFIQMFLQLLFQILIVAADS